MSILVTGLLKQVAKEVMIKLAQTCSIILFFSLILTLFDNLGVVL